MILAQKNYFWYNNKTMEQFNMFFSNSLGLSPLMVGVLMVWIIFWKGCSLWIASRNNHKIWFIALLVLNTMGILEIIYIFFIAKKKWSDIKRIISKSTPTKTE